MMKKRKINRKVLSLIMSIVMLIVAIFGFETFAYAENSIDDLKNQISDYNDKIAAAQEKLDSLESDMNDAQAYIETLDNQVQMYQEQIDAYNTQIKGYESQIAEYNAKNDELQKQIDEMNVQIDDLNTEINGLNVQVEEKYDELKSIIRANYITGESTAVEVLLTSDDFSDYLTKVQFVSSVADYEQGIVDDIKTSIDSINGNISEINKQKEQIAVNQKQIEQQIVEINTLQKSVESDKQSVVENQNAVNASINDKQTYLDSLTSQSNAYENEIEGYNDAIEEYNSEIESIIRAQASQGSGTLANSSGLICPLQYSGVYVSSGFYRNSDGSYHGALDLCVSGGTYGLAVSAAESGTVITATYHYSYGNYVLIDHGNGLSTLYAHNSSLAVSAGQKVTKGQTISYAGNTGNSYGAHVHFEVRVNGTRVDPANYISV